MAHPPIANLKAHYLLNETSGTTVYDNRGAYNMTADQDVSNYTTTGKINKGFTGIGDSSNKIIVGSSAIHAYPFSVCWWVKVPTRPATYSVTFWMGDKDATADYYAVPVINSNEQFGGQLRSGGVADNLYSNGFTLDAWVWSCFVAISATERYYFLDNNVYAYPNTSITLSGAWDRMTIGYYGDATPTYGLLTRVHSDIRVYDIALTEAQRDTIYNGGNGTEAESSGISFPWGTNANPGAPLLCNII